MLLLFFEVFSRKTLVYFGPHKIVDGAILGEGELSVLFGSAPTGSHLTVLKDSFGAELVRICRCGEW
jgi:hypothetical protein